jgi:hypothetical protein
MSQSYAQRLEDRARVYGEQLEKLHTENPFGVPITTAGWAGNGKVIRFAITNYVLHKAFPALIEVESIFRGLTYIYGCHTGSDISIVCAVGTVSKEVANWNKRADF